MLNPVLMSLIRDQFSTTTWLLIGASLQTLCFALLPFRFTAALPVGTLAYLIARTVLQSTRWIQHNPSPAIYKGRFTVSPPADYSADPQPIVVFILGFQSYHHLGRLGPGAREVGEFFGVIIKEAEANRAESGYLGGSGSMLTTDGESSNALMNITYWSDLSKLDKFSKKGVHLQTLKWWSEFSPKYPHLGKSQSLLPFPPKPNVWFARLCRGKR